jgi:hypothetical protein
VATKEQHRAKAEHNEFFCSTLGNPFWDWKVTGLFYVAVHHVHVYFESKHVTLPLKMNHEKRLTLVEWHLSEIFEDYRELLSNSRYARYEPAHSFSQDDVQKLEKRLEKIKNCIVAKTK